MSFWCSLRMLVIAGLKTASNKTVTWFSLVNNLLFGLRYQPTAQSRDKLVEGFVMWFNLDNLPIE